MNETGAAEGSTAATWAKAVDFPEPGGPQTPTTPRAPASSSRRTCCSSGRAAPPASVQTRGRTVARRGAGWQTVEPVPGRSMA